MDTHEVIGERNLTFGPIFVIVIYYCFLHMISTFTHLITFF